jgi:cytochrome b
MSHAGIAPTGRVRIWDWPTRAFHWAIVLLIPAMWWTAENDRIALHMQLGLVMLALVLFRIIWGLIGSSTARFGNFLKSPRGVVSYLNGRAAQAIGHNPLGGLSVAAMLLVLAMQVGLGLFASNEDGDLFGPLALMVSGDTSETLTDRHETMFNILLALIALHIAAILFYALVRRRNLIGAMLTGRGNAPEGVKEMRGAPIWRLAIAVAISMGTAAWLWTRL